MERSRYNVKGSLEGTVLPMLALVSAAAVKQGWPPK